MMNNIWHGKRALYILFSLIVEDLSCLCACSCYISAQCGQFGRLALTRLIPMALLIIISASQVFIMTLITYLVIVTKVHSNTDVYLYLKWATNDANGPQMAMANHQRPRWLCYSYVFKVFINETL